MIYAANIDENELADQGKDNKHVIALKQFAEKEGAQVLLAINVLENGFVVVIFFLCSIICCGYCDYI